MKKLLMRLRSKKTKVRIRKSIKSIRAGLSDLRKKLFGGTFRRVVLFIFVAAIVYGASGIVVVPSNAYLYLTIQSSERFTYWQPYAFTGGAWWIQPGLTHEMQITNSDIPTTDDFLAMAWYYDQEYDALVARGQLFNPRTDAEFEAMAATIVAYLRTVDGPFFKDFVFNGVTFFVPDRATPSKYDVDMAHWSRILVDENNVVQRTATGWYVNDNSIYVNHVMLSETIRKGDQSIFGLLTHELTHGALSITIPPTGEGYFDQETLNQTITAYTLYGMAQQHIPGAAAAFMEHMRNLALYSAKYRAYFNSDLAVPSYYGNLAMGAEINAEASREANLPTSWEPPINTVTRHDYLKTFIEILKGNQYSNEYRVDKNPFPIMDWAKQTIMHIRQNGIHIRPYTILRETIGYHKWWADLGRQVLGTDFVYWEWAPITGEIERVDAMQTTIFGRAASPEYEEKWKTNNSYFADVWYRYEYGALMTIVGNVNYGMPITWYGMETSDFNALIAVYMGFPATEVFAARTIGFDPATWNGLLSPLGLKHWVLPENGLCIRVTQNGPCVAKNISSMVYGEWRPFPSIPLAFGLLLILDVLAMKKWGTRRTLAKRIAVRMVPIFYVPVGFIAPLMVRAATATKTWRRRNK